MIAVCLHGFLRSGLSMVLLARKLQDLGYKEVIFPTHPYHRMPLEKISRRLERQIHQAMKKHNADHVDVITYSMGGLVFRACLERDIPFRRVLMIAPPNQGAEMAAQIRTLLPVHKLGWDPFAALLPSAIHALQEPASNIEIGILAGIKGNQKGFNSRLSTDNDGKVRLEETYLSRNVPHYVVQSRHSMMIVSPKILNISHYFMKNGHFPKENIPKEKC